MNASEVLIFRNYSGWEEPALMTPLGFMSLRNLAVVGVFGMLAGLLYWLIVPDNLDITRDWQLVCAALCPLGAGVALAAAKPAVGTADSVLLALLALAIGRPSATKGRQKGQKAKGRKKSAVLGYPKKITAARAAERIQEIACADFDELKSVRITLHAGDGSLVGNRIVRCYLDDELIDTLRTSSEGTLVLHMRPEREGGRVLLVRDDADRVLLRRPLHFVRRRVG